MVSYRPCDWNISHLKSEVNSPKMPDVKALNHFVMKHVTVHKERNPDTFGERVAREYYLS